MSSLVRKLRNRRPVGQLRWNIAGLIPQVAAWKLDCNDFDQNDQSCKFDTFPSGINTAFLTIRITEFPCGV